MRSTVGDIIEILYPICGTGWVPERPYVFYDSPVWWGVQETASADLLGFVLLDTSLFVQLHRGAAHSKKNALFNVVPIVPEGETMTFAGWYVVHVT